MKEDKKDQGFFDKVKGAMGIERVEDNDSTAELQHFNLENLKSYDQIKQEQKLSASTLEPKPTNEMVNESEEPVLPQQSVEESAPIPEPTPVPQTPKEPEESAPEVLEESNELVDVVEKEPVVESTPEVPAEEKIPEQQEALGDEKIDLQLEKKKLTDKIFEFFGVKRYTDINEQQVEDNIEEFENPDGASSDKKMHKLQQQMPRLKAKEVKVLTLSKNEIIQNIDEIAEELKVQEINNLTVDEIENQRVRINKEIQELSSKEISVDDDVLEKKEQLQPLEVKNTIEEIDKKIAYQHAMKEKNNNNKEISKIKEDILHLVRMGEQETEKSIDKNNEQEIDLELIVSNSLIPEEKKQEMIKGKLYLSTEEIKEQIEVARIKEEELQEANEILEQEINDPNNDKMIKTDENIEELENEKQQLIMNGQVSDEKDDFKKMFEDQKIDGKSEINLKNDLAFLDILQNNSTESILSDIENIKMEIGSSDNINIEQTNERLEALKQRLLKIEEAKEDVSEEIINTEIELNRINSELEANDNIKIQGEKVDKDSNLSSMGNEEVEQYIEYIRKKHEDTKKEMKDYEELKNKKEDNEQKIEKLIKEIDGTKSFINIIPKFDTINFSSKEQNMELFNNTVLSEDIKSDLKAKLDGSYFLGHKSEEKEEDIKNYVQAGYVAIDAAQNNLKGLEESQLEYEQKLNQMVEPVISAELSDSMNLANEYESKRETAENNEAEIEKLRNQIEGTRSFISTIPNFDTINFSSEEQNRELFNNTLLPEDIKTDLISKLGVGYFLGHKSEEKEEDIENYVQAAYVAKDKAEKDLEKLEQQQVKNIEDLKETEQRLIAGYEKDKDYIPKINEASEKNVVSEESTPIKQENITDKNIQLKKDLEDKLKYLNSKNKTNENNKAILMVVALQDKLEKQKEEQEKDPLGAYIDSSEEKDKDDKKAAAIFKPGTKFQEKTKNVRSKLSKFKKWGIGAGIVLSLVVIALITKSCDHMNGDQVTSLQDWLDYVQGMVDSKDVNPDEAKTIVDNVADTIGNTSDVNIIDSSAYDTENIPGSVPTDPQFDPTPDPSIPEDGPTPTPDVPDTPDTPDTPDVPTEEVDLDTQNPGDSNPDVGGSELADPDLPAQPIGEGFGDGTYWFDSQGHVFEIGEDGLPTNNYVCELDMDKVTIYQEDGISYISIKDGVEDASLEDISTIMDRDNVLSNVVAETEPEEFITDDSTLSSEDDVIVEEEEIEEIEEVEQEPTEELIEEEIIEETDIPVENIDTQTPVTDAQTPDFSELEENTVEESSVLNDFGNAKSR